MQHLQSVSWRVLLAQSLQDRYLLIILLSFVLLSTTWNFATPIFEAPDEPDHLQYIFFVAETGRRPDLQTEIPQAGIEAPQPPLYYFLMAGVLRVGGISRSFTHPQINPDFDFLWMDSAPNYFLPFAGNFDYIHVLRAFSTLFGVITVVCAYWISVLLGLRSTLSLAAAAVTACLPQFTFISAAISNDPLTIAVASVALVWLVYTARRKSERASDPIIYGLLSALAFLSKSHAIFLLPFGIAVLLAIRPSGLLGSLKNLGWMIVGFLLVAGPYLVYNQWRYGDWTAVNMQALIVPELVARKSLLDAQSLAYFTTYLPRLLFQSFLGVFGWMRIYLPAIFYTLFGILWLASLGGYALALLHKRWDLLRETLLLAPVLMFLVIVYVNLTFTAPQGRYFFPALAAISPLFVMGLAELPAPWHRVAIIGAPLFLLLTNLFSLWLVHNTFLG